MQRVDAPRLQVFRPEVAKVEGDDDGRLGVDSGRQDMAILHVVCHARNQCLIAADPCLAEVGAQFSLETILDAGYESAARNGWVAVEYG